MLETRWLEAFVEVARRGSVTAAARALGRSQPAVSHRLRQLEEVVGAPLFEKVGRGLQLTELGERFLRESHAVLGGLRGLEQLGQRAGAAVRGRVRVGSFSTLTRHVLLEVVARLLDEHEGVQVVARLGYAGTLCDALRAGQLDLVLLVGATPHEDLEVEALGVIRPVAVLHPSAAPAGDGALGVEALRGRRYLAWRGPSDEMFDDVERFAMAAGLLGGSTPEIPHIDTLSELVRRGLGYSILPDYTVREAVAAGALRARAVVGLERTYPVVALTRAGQPHGPALAAVRGALRQVMRDGLSGTDD